jgi:hypothetical protein
MALAYLPFSSMENGSFEKTQRYLMQLLGYLEGIHSSMDWESEENRVTASPSGLPLRIEAILSHSGCLEGLRLKSQGCLSSDILEFIHTVGMAFEIEATPRGAFKLPFVDSEIGIQRKTMNDFMEKAWLVYHSALLSAYTLKALRFIRSPSEDGLEETVRILESSDPEPQSRAWDGIDPNSIHAMNNSLSGIMGYVTLILAERKFDADLQEKLGLVLEATKRATANLPST